MINIIDLLIKNLIVLKKYAFKFYEWFYFNFE